MMDAVKSKYFKYSMGFALPLALAAASLHAQVSPIAPGSLAVKLTSLATINAAADGTPQDLAFAPDNSGRLFVATRNGAIRIINNGALDSTPFLNVASTVSVYTGGEGGLLGLAFSPNYAADGKFYTLETETFGSNGTTATFSQPELFPATSVTPNNQVALREWTVSANPNVAAPSSRLLLTLNHPESNHQGGGLRFGPDGNLYIGLGDGGGGNDFDGTPSSAADGHNNAVGNGQDTTVPLGKILRINPNPAAGAGFITSANGQYSVPTTNPFISGPGGSLPEIYAFGMRNPYKITFDTATGKLYVADVGQGQREEVDSVVNGGNYGWPFREGTRDNSADAGRPTPGGFASLAPLLEYTHADGESIIGGVLYRGSAIPQLIGDLVFGDLGGAAGNTIGRLFYGDPATGAISEFTYAAGSLLPSANLYAVTSGPDGEMYALFSNGSILAISPVPEPATFALLAVGMPLLLRRRRR